MSSVQCKWQLGLIVSIVILYTLLTTLHLCSFSGLMTNARYQFTIPSTTTILGGCKVCVGLL